MTEEHSEWQTPNEIRKKLGQRKCDALLDDLGHERKSRPEILEIIMTQAKCNVYSADDFLRDLLKNPSAE